MLRAFGHAAAAGAVLLCAATATAQTDIRLLSGILAPEGGPVPPGALAIVEAVDADGRVVSEAALGASGPGPFAFEIGLPAGTGTELRAAIFVDAEPRWALSGLAVDGTAEALAEPEIALPRHVALAPDMPLHCGSRDLALGVFGDRAILADGDRRIVLAAPGPGAARFEAPGADTALTRRGNRVDVRLGGIELPECAPRPPARVRPYRAGGNEPGWSATVENGALRLSLDDGVATSEAPVDATALDGAAVIVAAGAARLRIDPGLCRDTMSGMPFPDTATLAAGDRTTTGCGGDPRDLLTGAPWRVTRLDGAEVPAAIDVTLDFGEDGRLGGSAGCNRYMTSFGITGETASPGQIAATRRLCPDPEMDTEARFLGALAAIRRFDFDATGALLLFDPAREVPAIVATR
jgi:heat shock protein HslJ